MSPLFRFGPFELDPDREELRRSGLVLRLAGQPFQILRMLVEKQGEVVTREEIQTAIWGDETYVGFEQGINTAIRQIRAILGDNAEAPRYVRTVPRRGYLFIAPVEQVARAEEVEEVAAPVVVVKPRSRTLILIAAAMVVVLAAGFFVFLAAMRHRPHAKRITVNAFRAIGTKGIDERTFAEELRATIGSLPAQYVTLVARADRQVDIIVDGTVQKTPDGIRVIVSAVDAQSHAQLWSETYERPNDWIDGMPIETAHRFMQTIAQRYLPPARHEPILVTHGSTRACELYRRARTERAQDLDRARTYFEAALAEEPEFAEAMSGLADTWGERMLSAPPRIRTIASRQSTQYAKRALALQPCNAEAWSALGLVALQYEYDLRAGEEHFRKAVTCEPDYGDAHFNLAVALTTRGKFDEAQQEYATARQLDPVSFDLHHMEPLLHLHARRYDDALRRFRESLAVNRHSPMALMGVTSVFAKQQQWAQAIEASQTIASERQIPKRNVPATREGFHEVYREIEPFILDANRRGIFNDYAVAMYYAELGERDRAIERLQRAIANHAPSVSYILVDPRLDPLRGDPRFYALLRGTKLGPPRELLVTLLQNPEKEK